MLIVPNKGVGLAIPAQHLRDFGNRAPERILRFRSNSNWLVIELRRALKARGGRNILAHRSPVGTPGGRHIDYVHIIAGKADQH